MNNENQRADNEVIVMRAPTGEHHSKANQVIMLGHLGHYLV
jgi:hypothetical protein